MKAIALGIVMLAVTAAAQAPPQAPPPRRPPTPPASQAPPPVQQATPVEPKHSEATATLRAVEAEKSDLITQRQNVANQANELIGNINQQLEAKGKESDEQQRKIREENGWGDEYAYVPAQQMQDGTKTPAHWQKALAKK